MDYLCDYIRHTCCGCRHLRLVSKRSHIIWIPDITSNPTHSGWASELKHSARKKEIRIVHEDHTSYTFLDLGSLDNNSNSVGYSIINTNKKLEKEIIKTRSFDSKKPKFRYNDRITGGQNQQGHSSVYE